MLRIASIDIGRKNYAVYIGDVDGKSIEKLSEVYDALPKKYQRRVKGAMNKEVEKIHNDLFMIGTRIHTSVFDFQNVDENGKSTDMFDIQTRRNLFKYLRSLQELWDKCDIIRVEQQYFKTVKYKGHRPGGRGANRNPGTECNIAAVKVAEATVSWFTDNYPFKDIDYFPSAFKTHTFGAPDGLSKDQRKKWATEKGKEVYTMKEDLGMMKIFEASDMLFRKRRTKEKCDKVYIQFKNESDDIQKLAKKVIYENQKLDDVMDAFLQFYAFVYRMYIAKF